MLLPNANEAVIDAVKLRGYVLSFNHPVGRFKARFFAALGFTADTWPVFERALREQHLTQAASPMLTPLLIALFRDYPAACHYGRQRNV